MLCLTTAIERKIYVDYTENLSNIHCLLTVGTYLLLEINFKQNIHTHCTSHYYIHVLSLLITKEGKKPTRDTADFGSLKVSCCSGGLIQIFGVVLLHKNNLRNFVSYISSP
uniref:Uncharacterized protein n=1 Tax=Cacopsylla melanoneura TaxID=428564 RepID=A0A8D8ZBV7_9HEMI